jgi:tetratricopeptide (TPR) repeat protein
MPNQKQFFLLKAVIPVSILVIVTFIAYRGALNNDFVTWDTGAYIVDNPHIKAFTGENLKWMFTAFYAANWHPLTWLSHAIDYALFGMKPWGHHLSNLIIHSLNVIEFFMLAVVLLTLSTATSPLQFAWTKIDNKVLLGAFVAALFFGIHPQHVESVAWLAERKDVLCLLFILLAWLSYLFYALRTRLVWYIASLVCFILALLSKPMAVTLPVILILMDIYPLRRTTLTIPSQPVPYKTLVLEKIPFFVLTLISAILTILAQQSSDAMVSIQTMGILLRFLNACNSIILYISKFLLPVGFSPMYVMSSFPNYHHYYLSLVSVMAVVLSSLVCGYLWYAKKQYYWLIAWLFYLVTLTPVLGLIQVGSQSAADRYAYLPTLPFYVLIGMGVATLYYQQELRKFFKVGLTIGLLVIMLQLVRLTQEQTWIWKNDVTLWAYAVLYDPDNPITQMNLGVAYSYVGEYEKAIAHLKMACTMSRDRLIYLNLLGLFLKLNRLSDLLTLYQQILDANLDIGQTKDTIYYEMGKFYYKQGNLGKAQEVLKKALVINPNHESAKSFLAQLATQGKK